MTFAEYYDEQIRTAEAYGLRLSEKEKRQIAEDWARHFARKKDPSIDQRRREAEDAWERRWLGAVLGERGDAYENIDTRDSFDSWMEKLGGSDG